MSILAFSRALGVAASLIAVTSSATACSEVPTATPRPTLNLSASTATADITIRWNALARSLIVAAKPNQQEALRALAYLSLAQYQAAVDAAVRPIVVDAGSEVEATSPERIYWVSDRTPARPDRAAQLRGAIAGASAGVLREIFKAHVATIDAALAAEQTTSIETGERRQDFDLGVDAGREVAANVMASAATDNFDATWTGTVPTGSGVWFSGIGRPPLLPALGTMRPFFMTSGSQFRPAPPPAYGSPAFEAALAEIRAYSDTRTARQDSVAKFWAMATGTLAAGYWNEVATTLIERYGLNALRATRVLALMNTAAMDANIACHDAKYTYWVIRPSQADPNIKPAIGLPNHPSFPSNHACVSGTAALILAEEFPAERAEMERQSAEATTSRYYAGLHYRFDGEAGLEIARQVSELAIRAGHRDSAFGTSGLGAKD